VIVVFTAVTEVFHVLRFIMKTIVVTDWKFKTKRSFKMKGNSMSHKLTMPEEVEFNLKQLEETEIKVEEIAKREISSKALDVWRVGYVPPFRAAYRVDKDNTK
jgi:uncharacterized protein YajQ (UPF0234 family)